mgnify:CR=1 FL=1
MGAIYINMVMISNDKCFNSQNTVTDDNKHLLCSNAAKGQLVAMLAVLFINVMFHISLNFISVGQQYNYV